MRSLSASGIALAGHASEPVAPAATHDVPPASRGAASDERFWRLLSAAAIGAGDELAHTANQVDDVALLEWLTSTAREAAPPPGVLLRMARMTSESLAHRDALAEVNRQLHQVNTELVHRCAELGDQRASLMERIAALERANRDLAAFDHSVSHDLRAPLRAIDGFSRLLLDDYGDRFKADGRHLLDRLRSGSQRMCRLIDALLRLSTCSRVPLDRARIDVSALARAVATEITQDAPDRPLDLAIAPGLQATADPDLLRIVLVNLIGNAWKYTRPRPRAAIEIGGVIGSHPTVFFVRDDGVGFNMAYAHQLFAPFGRLHSETDFEGTGIGLATVQRIVERHAGKIWAESSVGGGATFFFTLSAAAAADTSGGDRGMAAIAATAGST
jgi:signal transduction histidine kinase